MGLRIQEGWTLLVIIITVNGTLAQETDEERSRELTAILSGADSQGPASVDLEIYAESLEREIESLPCTKHCSRFDPEWHHSMTAVKNHFLYLDLLDGNVTVENTLDNFRDLLRILVQKYTNHPEVNVDLIQTAGIVAIEEREDTGDAHVSPMDLFPEISASDNEAEEDQDPDGPATHASRAPRVIESESRVDYFREDNGLHLFHEEWHNINDERHPASRQQERFLYMHTILINRYKIERHTEGLPPVVNLDRSERQHEFNSYYRIDPVTDPNGRLVNFTSNQPTCQLTNQQRADLDSRERASIRALESPMEAFAREIQGNYHAGGHVHLSNTCGSGREEQSILWHTRTSARDPLFYRWHGEVDRYYKEYVGRRPAYTVNQLLPPNGVKIENFQLSAQCGGNNQVITYLERYQANHRVRLNHEDFTVTIRLSNRGDYRGRAIIRIFIGIQEFLNSVRWFVELDRFTIDVTGDPAQQISRRHDQFSSMQDVACKWPENLLLPKGNRFGMRFSLLAFINPVDGSVNEGMNSRIGNIYCGSQSRGVYDDRPHGFPLDRPWNGIDRLSVLNNNDDIFGSVSETIEIYHAGVQADPCNFANSQGNGRTVRSTDESTTTTTKKQSTEPSTAGKTTTNKVISTTGRKTTDAHTTKGSPGNTAHPKLPEPETLEEAEKYCASLARALFLDPFSSAIFTNGLTPVWTGKVRNTLGSRKVGGEDANFCILLSLLGLPGCSFNQMDDIVKVFCA